MKIGITSLSALIIVDVQNDFCPGGMLPVPRGDEVIPILNKYIEIFNSKKLPIYATRDWHPENHISFKTRGGPWPPHCIQNTWGAQFHPNLNIPPQTIIISKATEPDREAYSGFEGTNLKDSLESRGVKRVFIGGLATDYCVKETVMDALKIGFETVLLEDASRGIDINIGDSEKAVNDMVLSGAIAINLKDVKL
jgi:nicotinamidase/pyrazinamidase